MPVPPRSSSCQRCGVWNFLKTLSPNCLFQAKHSPILSEWWSIWDGELDTLLLGWEEVWLTGQWFSSREGAGEGLSGIRSWYKIKHKIIQFTYALILSRWFGNSIGNIHLLLILEVYTEQEMDLNTLKIFFEKLMPCN